MIFVALINRNKPHTWKLQPEVKDTFIKWVLIFWRLGHLKLGGQPKKIARIDRCYFKI